MGQGHQGGPLHGEDAAGPSRQVQARLPLTGDPRAHLAGGLLTCWFVNSEQAVKYLKLKNQKNSEKFPAT